MKKNPATTTIKHIATSVCSRQEQKTEWNEINIHCLPAILSEKLLSHFPSIKTEQARGAQLGKKFRSKATMQCTNINVK